MNNKRNIESDIFGESDSKKTINQRRKGQTNEKAVCKLLAAWTGQEFARIPASGGLRWKHTANIAGDVLCTNTAFFFPFTIETKHLKDFTVTAKLRENSKVFTIWQQAERDGLRANRIPILIVNKNYSEGRGRGKKTSYFIFMDKRLHEVLPVTIKWNYISIGEKDMRVLYGFKSDQFFQIDFLDLVGRIKLKYPEIITQ